MRGIERQRVGPLPIWGWGVISGALIWGLYVLTLAPTTGWWDTSEYIATAYILGIPHPPGNPLFVVLGRVWILALEPIGIPVATRINLLSATMSAAAAVFWFLAVVRIWAHFAEDRRQVVVAGLAAVLVGATAFTVWTQSNINEKVYTVSLLFVALVSYLAMLWEDETGTRRGDRLFVFVAFLLGLGATNHTMSILPIAALGAFVLWHDWRTLLRWRLVGAAAGLAAVGFTVQLLFVPIRSAQGPIINEGHPECENVLEALATPLAFVPVVDDVVPSSAICEPLRASLAREQYAKPPLTERQAPLGSQYANFWQYFDWQWARPLNPAPRAGVTLVFFLLGLVGLWRHWKGDRDSFVYFSVLLFTVTIALVFYLNFRFGYSLYPDIEPDLREVRERDYFYIIAFNMWGLYAGVGIAALWREAAERIRAARDGDRAAAGPGDEEAGAAGGASRSRDRAALLAAPVLALALVPLVLNFPWADRRGDYAARDWAYNLLQSVEPYGALFTNGDNDTFPLWYLQEVEGIRRDVTVMVHSYLGTPWYARQIRDLTTPCPPGVDPLETPTVIVCQRPFEPGTAASLYRGTAPEAPERAALGLDDRALATLPPGFRYPQDTVFQLSEWVQVPVREGELVTYPDLLVLAIVRHSLGDRPVHFAATAPPVYDRWSLQPQLLRRGLAHELVDGMLESTADTAFLGDRLDVPWIERSGTETLLWDDFQVAYLLDWDYWPEPSTRLSIPAQYYLVYAALGIAHEMREAEEAAERNYARAEALYGLSEARGP